MDISLEKEEFAQDLVYTMKTSPACVGIASPQVGVHKRIIAKHKENRLSHGLMVFVNPCIVQWDGELVCMKGYLSVPDYTGNVFLD